MSGALGVMGFTVCEGDKRVKLYVCIENGTKMTLSAFLKSENISNKNSPIGIYADIVFWNKDLEDYVVKADNFNDVPVDEIIATHTWMALKD